MPKFSVIIPLYNKVDHIQPTLESALSQSFQDFEIIIVNDGSTDGSGAVVATMTDPRIHLFNIKNQGVSHARNYGILQATADLIVFLDADDLWRYDHLQNLYTLHKTFPTCGLYATAYLRKNDNIVIPSVYKHIPTEDNWMGIVDDYFASSAVNSIAWTSAVMVPKSILENVGNFNENITLGAGEDTDLWIRIALEYPVAFSNKVTAIYNLHTENRISKSHTLARQFIDLDVYEAAATSNPSLKKYLDLNRFSIAIQYKLSGDIKNAKTLISKIDAANLNTKQRTLLKLNKGALKIAVKVKSRLQNSGVFLSTFR